MKNKNLLIQNGINVDKSLELFGDMEFYDSTLVDFLDEVYKKMDKLKECKENGDMVNYSVYAHSLKSDARYLGFEHLQELAYNHEIKSKANDIMYIYDHYDELIKETKRIINLVNGYLGNEREMEDSPKFVLKNKAILVVDDSEMIGNFIKKVFNDDFEVLTAYDGKEAIKYILDNNDNDKIKAALIDLKMPNMDGFELLDYFKENNLFVRIPASVITGADDKESINRSFKYPIVDLLTKPFNERDIKRVVEKTINYNK